MGLDITAYSNLKRANPQPEEDYDYDTQMYVYHNSLWEKEHRGDNLETGVYDFENSFYFRAGAYSSYNRWRAELCEFALGVVPETVWDNRKAYEGRPFYELINFSDCEGTLGPKVCAKLAKEFQDFDAKAKEKYSDPDDGFYYLYQEWKRAFEMAANGGAVRFH